MTMIIAEAGVNHNGDHEIAKRLVAEAAIAGADFVKFQTFKAADLVSADAPKAEYQQLATGEGSQRDMISGLELSRSDHELLIEECQRHEIGFFSTAFDEKSFDLLVDLGCLSMVKIPSGELTNLPLIRHMTRLGKPVLLSTGMATLGEIETAIEVIEAAGTDRSRITVLQCTTEYPAPMEDVNLRAIVSIKQAFGVETGYSDHTTGIEVAIAAVALGATVIEKHFTLDRNLPGPDHKASLEPAELKAMIDSIRNIERAMGDGVKRPTASELRNRPIARKSIVARHRIEAGEALTPDNLTVKRPGTGLSPMLWDKVVGKCASRAFNTDELIEL
jgi:N,N'-diacetyllegionaminate synthase